MGRLKCTLSWRGAAGRRSLPCSDRAPQRGRGGLSQQRQRVALEGGAKREEGDLRDERTGARQRVGAGPGTLGKVPFEEQLRERLGLRQRQERLGAFAEKADRGQRKETDVYKRQAVVLLVLALSS